MNMEQNKINSQQLTDSSSSSLIHITLRLSTPIQQQVASHKLLFLVQLMFYPAINIAGAHTQTAIPQVNSRKHSNSSFQPSSSRKTIRNRT